MLIEWVIVKDMDTLVQICTNSNSNGLEIAQDISMLLRNDVN